MKCEHQDCSEYAVRTVECTAPSHTKAAKGFCDLHARVTEQGYALELAALFIHGEPIMPPAELRCEHVSHAFGWLRCTSFGTVIVGEYVSGPVPLLVHKVCPQHVKPFCQYLKDASRHFDVLA